MDPHPAAADRRKPVGGPTASRALHASAARVGRGRAPGKFEALLARAGLRPADALTAGARLSIPIAVHA